MLRQRLLTAFILAPLLLIGVFFFSEAWFAALIAFPLLLAAWEWSGLYEIKHPAPRIALIILGVVGALVLYIGNSDDVLLWILGLSSLVWSGLFIDLLNRPVLANFGQRWIGLTVGTIGLIVAWLSFTALRQAEGGEKLVFILLAIIWVADSGAYFIGKRWGRRRLAPLISPGKSIEGLIGGIGSAALVGFVAALLLGFRDVIEVVTWTVVAILVSSISVVGDLAQSRIKRRCGKKDSGTLLPGHGGILDRIDSLLAAAPVYGLLVLYVLPQLFAGVSG
ncbi:MAG: phosphatidate cytidylyltransferase [Acidiferrobacteraceae bacterium]|nr:phosphatidate cytidylyltransferase [Acidiferrobacteraceae bacterium]MDP6123104.1 phosphatidate cytidylyltransferase [Arenicellales bacterium]MDP6672274.1 phosphatidate cytidylyltransferase [Arenicellales bacterium]MDP6723820.1 phosphatidate cytidylyltransferase [Arenicellales bacterium]